MRKLFFRIRYALLTAFVFCMMAVPAFAVGSENTQVTGAFLQLKEDLLATMTPIGTAAVAIAVMLFAWRYGRKIFQTIAK